MRVLGSNKLVNRPQEVASYSEVNLPGLAMPRKKGRPGEVSPQRSPNAAALPSWLDPDGSHGKLWVLLMKPADEGTSLPSNPFTLAKSVQTTVGTIAEAYRDKEQNLVLKVRGEDKVKKLLRMDQLIDGTKVVVTEHPRLNLTKVVVTCHSVSSMSDEELKAESTMQAQGVIDVRRFRKGGPTMTLTIRGTVAPEAIFFGFDRCRTKPYVQAPLQCYRCFEFGHPKAKCTAEEICRNCSTPHEIAKDQEGKTICNKPPRCKHCNGSHSPASRTCEKYQQEEEIEKIRSTGKSPREARRMFEEQQRRAGTSFASVAAAAGPSSSIQARLAAAQQQSNEDLKKELANTQKALTRALEELEKLKASIPKNALEKVPEKEKDKNKNKPKFIAAPTQPNNELPNEEMETDDDSDSTSSIESAGKRKHSSDSESSGSTLVDSEEEKEDQKPLPNPNSKTPNTQNKITPNPQNKNTSNPQNKNTPNPQNKNTPNPPNKKTKGSGDNTKSGKQTKKKEQ